MTGRTARRTRLGPGLIITASFVGPGTVTTATVTGASYGFALAWTIVFSIVATIVLQEMAARLGLATRQGLGEALRATFTHSVGRWFVIVLIVAAIGIGGASYAGGDTTGTSLGLATLTRLPQPVVVLLVGATVFALLATGSYQRIERTLILLVGVMSAVFILTAIVAAPDLIALLKGMLVPTIPNGALLTTVALIGTTVVPYNLFLHASLVQEKWADTETGTALAESRRDTALSISLGGLITLAILTAAAASLFVNGIEATSSAAMAGQLEPVLGPAAPYVFAVGLFAAGLTSAIAGPLGAAYAISSILGWSTDLRSLGFRAIWATVVVIGAVIALTGINPIAIIVLAQAANGLLLPIVAGFLLVVMNSRSLLGQHRNGPFANTAGALVLLVVTGLAIYQLADVFGLLPA
ncbi:MAG: Nramp family divalent metal transporter [Actinomycetota bacterium]|nr:Nramp family divalent metal transporter [Actinomycetota bacterium]